MPPDVLERFEEKLGDWREALAHQDLVYADLRFLLDHLPEWREEHPNRWVAVYREELIVVEDTHERLIKEIKEKGIPLADVTLDFISEEKVAYIL